MKKEPRGGLVRRILANSAGRRAGMRPSDRLLEINDAPVADVLDTQFFASDGIVHLAWMRDDKRMERTFSRPSMLPLGLEFEHPTFDTIIRTCNNRCPFCFVAQMPRGMRRTLVVKDDDYRYSFLFGHFVTLTNLKEADWRKITEQRLSPLYVSVHSTEPEVRIRCLGNPKAGDILARLRFLTGQGIEVHAQVVVIPGWNDGARLERTLLELAELYPGVRSCSVVPVGLTKFHRGGLSIPSDKQMRQVLKKTAILQKKFLQDTGSRFAFPTDEWFLAVRLPVPPQDFYEGLDLRENGLGIVREFWEKWFVFLEKQTGNKKVLHGKNAVLMTGALFAAELSEAAKQMGELTGCSLAVKPVRNRFFGETVTVAGLLTAGDILTEVRHFPQDGRALILPKIVFSHPELLSLDGATPLDVARQTGRVVYLAEHMADVYAALTDKNPMRARPVDKKLSKRFINAGGWDC